MGGEFVLQVARSTPNEVYPGSAFTNRLVPEVVGRPRPFGSPQVGGRVHNDELRGPRNVMEEPPSGASKLHEADDGVLHVIEGESCRDKDLEKHQEDAAQAFPQQDQRLSEVIGEAGG